MPPILILDGGLGTSLEQKYNIKFTRDRPLWSSDPLVSDPETLQKCQADFGKVPVDILLTATYQVSVKGFSGTKSQSFPNGIPSSEIPQFLETAIQVAQKSILPSAQIALSVGPYGACMVPSQEYSGDYDIDHATSQALFQWHRERMSLFASVADIGNRAGFVALETIPRLDEIIVMRRALAAEPTLAGLPFWISCLYPANDRCLPDGTPAAAAVQAMLDPTLSTAVPWAIGINCTKVSRLDPILKEYETTISEMVGMQILQEWPALVLYPDGTNGQAYNTVTQKWEQQEPQVGSRRVPWEEQLREVVRNTGSRGQWKQIIVGGCCMASSEDIGRLRVALTE